MKNRMIEKIGASLILLATFAYIGLTFLVDNSFQKTDASELDKIKGPDFTRMLTSLDDAPPAIMFSQVGEKINQYNHDMVSQKGISSEEQKAILAELDGKAATYSEDVIENSLKKKDWAKEKLTEYTSWMIGRDWESFEAFEGEFKAKVSDVNAAVVNEFGVGDGGRENFRMEVMKAGTPDWLRSGMAAWLIFGLATLGSFIYLVPLAQSSPGIKNDHIYHRKSQTGKGSALLVFAALVAFYIVLYKFPAFLVNQSVLLDPLSEWMSGGASSQWFLYGFLYTLTMFIMGLRMFLKYRGNKYQQVRTASVFFFQVVFAFTLPQILTRLQLPAYDLKSAWPLEYTFFFDYRIDEYLQEGTLGLFLLFWGIILFAIGVPVFTYFYGKRWYCSWVCGCGGLAETVGDPYRHLSDKRLGAWKIERYLIHSVLVFAVVMTVWVAYTAFTGTSELLGISSYSIRSTYGFLIGFVFAGAVGTGFYPVMGSRVWCRFGCPLAAYLGFVQRFKSRFRITTNGGQCISCGNCSTYCEMGIDVRWYAQRGQNIVRSSCVGCGVCSSVCPRGVLKLENGPEEGRINENPIIIGSEGAKLNLSE